MQYRLKPQTVLLCAAICSCFSIAAQQPAAVSKDTGKKALVEVVVTDTKMQPRKGEQILLQAGKSGTTFTGRSDAGGKFSISLPAGDQYTIRVKALNDTTQYGTLDIPSLGEGEEFSEPFGVDIQFEPARSYTLDKVFFDFGKASLRPESYKELNELAEYLQWRDQEKVEIAGHTDNVGKDADNLKLSQQRAEAVRNYLLKKGIKANRIFAKGYGASEPVAENTTDAGRQQNRRTELRFLD
jgi:OmpA-OmpF porin, OOP family